MTLDELLEQFDEVLDSGIKIPGKKTVVSFINPPPYCVYTP